MKIRENAEIAPKWCDFREAHGSVAESARLCLGGRIAAVRGLLELTVHQGAVPEHVHQMRVWTRRALAALDLFHALLPKGDRKWFRKQLKRIRESAGTARDLDVLIARYSASTEDAQERIAIGLSKRRASADRTVHHIYERLVDSGKLSRRQDKLLEGIKSVAMPIDEWLATRITSVTAAVQAAAPYRHSDFKRLHRFRIRLKQLRYVIEICAGELDTVYRTTLYEDVCSTLELLGNLNDHVTAAGYLKRELARTKRKGHRRRCKELLAQEKQAAKELRTTFLEAWPRSELAQWTGIKSRKGDARRRRPR